ncbi:MAG: 2-amino-4-hydroxy-6-hydroxymethyldihydropteridine diphosphokinase [Muribaculaceae bacterium]|nr:2-amino-4-hydroxy-6-hydroxymethyldihydropteridine diphosphokinase [Muribaculaceae bacterium]
MTYYLNLGSNLGNPRLNLTRAMKAVGDEFGPYELSHAVESKPQGFDSTRMFMNIGLTFESELDPEEVLSRLQAIEKHISPASHRRADGSYADRMIDIDIIAVDELTFDTHHLHVPHPRMASRLFVLEPMAELAPAWRHPRTGLTCAEMIASLTDNR